MNINQIDQTTIKTMYTHTNLDFLNHTKTMNTNYINHTKNKTKVCERRLLIICLVLIRIIQTQRQILSHRRLILYLTRNYFIFHIYVDYLVLIVLRVSLLYFIYMFINIIQ